MRQSPFCRALLLLVIAVTAACSGSNESGEGGPVPVSIEVTAPVTSSKYFRPITLTAVATFDNGFVQNVTDIVQWRSSDTSVATVQVGTVEGKKAGMVNVEASLGEIAASVSLEFTDPAVTSLAIDQRTVTAVIDEPSNVVVTATFEDETTEDVSALTNFVTDQTEVATITGGVVQGMDIGVATFEAIFGGESVEFVVIGATVDQTELREKAANVYAGSYFDGESTFEGVAIVMPDGSYWHNVYFAAKEWAHFRGYVSLTEDLVGSVSGQLFEPWVTYSATQRSSFNVTITEGQGLAGSFIGPDGRVVEINLTEVPPTIQPYDERVDGDYLNTNTFSYHGFATTEDFVMGVSADTFFGFDNFGCEHVGFATPADRQKGLMYLDLEVACPSALPTRAKRFEGIVMVERFDQQGTMRWFGVSLDGREFYYDEAYRTFPFPGAPGKSSQPE